ncbi:MAG: CBS domain-containing protein [Planctomycetota bacterium]
MRALLATRWTTRATQIAAVTGQAMASLFGFVGFCSTRLWLSRFSSGLGRARGERGTNEVVGWNFRAAGDDYRFTRRLPADPLSAVEKILAGSQHDFPVVDHGQSSASSRDKICLLACREGAETLVQDAMQREFLTVEAAEMLETAFRRLQECPCHTVPVLRRGELIGIVTMDNVGEFVAIQAALENRMVSPG